MDKIQQAEAELRQIEMQIDQLRARRDALMRFIAMSRELFAEPSAPQPAISPSARLREIAGRARIRLQEIDQTDLLKQRNATMQERIIQIAESLIKQSGAARTREIVQVALMRGINVTGHNMAAKVLTTSAILSKSEKFIADRSRGWTLKEESKNP